MPFGTHRGKKMKDVPAQYLDFIRDNKCMEAFPQVAAYIDNNRKVIDIELGFR